MADILIIDDEPGVSWAYAKAARSMGHLPQVAGTAEEGLSALKGRRFDLALLDVQLPGMGGLEALTRISAEHPQVPVIVLTAYGTMETAVEAIRRGALDYLLKPIELDDLKGALSKGVEAAQSRRRIVAATAPASPTGIVGRCSAMLEVFKRIGMAAGSDLPVLIEGETGTGKELVSQSIHRHSPRSGGPCILVNGTCLPRELLESELFGHTKGAFTGAVSDKPGQVELAQGGTLFLDEVGELPLETQASLLRFAETRKAARVGSHVPYHVDVRLVAATNRNLRLEVEAGRFRRDLYYRLNALTIKLPPLRDRGDDLDLLIDHFVRRSSQRTPDSPAQLTDAARRRLREHSWPGNVRELKNAIEHAVLLARGAPIRPEHLPETLRDAEDVGGDDVRSRLAPLAAALLDQALAGDVPTADFEQLLKEFERPLLSAAMRRFSGNQAKLAGALKLHRTTLRKKLREYGLIESAGDDGESGDG